jgi:putative membrane protein
MSQSKRGLRLAAYLGGVLGTAVLVVLLVRSDSAAILHALRLGGWNLFWLVPYRALFFLLYAVGWYFLLLPYDSTRQAGLGYVFWVTNVREAIDRLLPVASVGGGIVGVRLLRLRGLPMAGVSATVVAEILLTLVVVLLFGALGLMLLFDINATAQSLRNSLLTLLLGSLVPLGTALLLRYGSIFGRLERFIRPFVGDQALSGGGAALDHEIRASLRRGGPLFLAGTLQLAAFISGSFEIWFALRLFGHPVGFSEALILESMTQSIRHLAFIIPAGIGVQEASLVLFGHALGISGELALAVSMSKRMREVLCGLPALISWQWLEGRRLHAA